MGSSSSWEAEVNAVLLGLVQWQWLPMEGKSAVSLDHISTTWVCLY